MTRWTIIIMWLLLCYELNILPQVSSQMNPATVQDLTNNAGKVINPPIWQVCISFCSKSIKPWFHTAGQSVIKWCHSTIKMNQSIESLNSTNNSLINVRISIINQSILILDGQSIQHSKQPESRHWIRSGFESSFASTSYLIFVTSATSMLV